MWWVDNVLWSISCYILALGPEMPLWDSPDHTHTHIQILLNNFLLHKKACLSLLRTYFLYQAICDYFVISTVHYDNNKIALYISLLLNKCTIGHGILICLLLFHSLTCRYCGETDHGMNETSLCRNIILSDHWWPQLSQNQVFLCNNSTCIAHTLQQASSN